MDEFVGIERTQKIEYKPTTAYKLIYIFRVNDENHKDMLKIGDASISTDEAPEALFNSCNALNIAAKARIAQYSSTIGVIPQILHTELAVRDVRDDNGNATGKKESFREITMFTEYCSTLVFRRLGPMTQKPTSGLPPIWKLRKMQLRQLKKAAKS